MVLVHAGAHERAVTWQVESTMQGMTAKLTDQAKQSDVLRRQLAQAQCEAARQAQKHAQEQEASVASMASVAQESREMQDRVDAVVHERDRLADALQQERAGWHAEREGWAVEREGWAAERDQLASDRAARESDQKRAVQPEGDADADAEVSAELEVSGGASPGETQRGSERDFANEKLVAELYGKLRGKGRWVAGSAERGWGENAHQFGRTRATGCGPTPGHPTRMSLPSCLSTRTHSHGTTCAYAHVYAHRTQHRHAHKCAHAHHQPPFSYP